MSVSGAAWRERGVARVRSGKEVWRRRGVHSSLAGDAFTLFSLPPASRVSSKFETLRSMAERCGMNRSPW